jgi:phosphohistidine phosphatase
MPKEILLVRHAKSSWKETHLSDHDRPLNKRGIHDAPLMAKVVKSSGFNPDIILSSTAVRAKSTAEAFAEEFGLRKKKFVLLEELYMAGDDDFFDVLHSLDEDVRSVMIFSHNPGITEFANLLCNTDIANIPTCGIFRAMISHAKWKDVKPGTGKFISFDFPKNHYEREN